MSCIRVMKSVILIFRENASYWAFFMCAIIFASKIWSEMAHKIFCLKILVGPPVALSAISLQWWNSSTFGLEAEPIFRQFHFSRPKK